MYPYIAFTQYLVGYAVSGIQQIRMRQSKTLISCIRFSFDLSSHRSSKLQVLISQNKIRQYIIPGSGTKIIRIRNIYIYVPTWVYSQIFLVELYYIITNVILWLWIYIHIFLSAGSGSLSWLGLVLFWTKPDPDPTLEKYQNGSDPRINPDIDPTLEKNPDFDPI